MPIYLVQFNLKKKIVPWEIKDNVLLKKRILNFLTENVFDEVLKLLNFGSCFCVLELVV